MKIFKLFTLLLFVFVIEGGQRIMAQGPVYKIENVNSKLAIQKDYSLLVETTVDVNFSEKSQGIIWYIPYSNLPGDKTKKESQNRIKILTITDGIGEILPYKTENLNLDKKITIGDANKTVSDKQTYRVKYLRKDVAQDMGDHMEIGWGLIGENRTSPIMKTAATVESPYFKILKTGIIETGSIANQKYDFKLENNKIYLNLNAPIQISDNLGINISVEKNNGIQVTEQINNLLANKKMLIYVALLAALMLLMAWLIRKRG